MEIDLTLDMKIEEAQTGSRETNHRDL